MRGMFSATAAILFKFQLIRSCAFVLCCRVVSFLTFRTRKCDNNSHIFPSIRFDEFLTAPLFSINGRLFVSLSVKRFFKSFISNHYP